MLISEKNTIIRSTGPKKIREVTLLIRKMVLFKDNQTKTKIYMDKQFRELFCLVFCDSHIVEKL